MRYYIKYKQSNKEFYFSGADGKRVKLDLQTANQVLLILRVVHTDVKLEPEE